MATVLQFSIQYDKYDTDCRTRSSFLPDINCHVKFEESSVYTSVQYIIHIIISPSQVLYSFRTYRLFYVKIIVNCIRSIFFSLITERSLIHNRFSFIHTFPLFLFFYFLISKVKNRSFVSNLTIVNWAWHYNVCLLYTSDAADE